MKYDFDIAIIGGGINGQVLSLAAANAGFSVALIDKNKIVDDNLREFDGRAYAIAFSSVQMMKNLNLWNQIGENAQPIFNIKVTHGTIEKGPASAKMQFSNADIEESPMAQMLEDRFLRHCLNTEIKKNGLIDLIEQSKVHEIADFKQKKQITLNKKSKILASLIVASDGIDSPTAKIFGIKKTGWKYKQKGLVCAIEHEHSSKNTAYQYFLPSGPLAILPINNHTASIVWTESIQNASTLTEMNDPEFLSVLQNRFGDFLGQLKLTGKRLSFPLKLSISTKYVSDKFAVVGDAAHGYHPIAGQGLNAGMRDIAALVDVISSARYRGENFSSINVLNRYQEWRRFDNQSLGFATDNLNKMFSSYDPLLGLLKNLSMKIVENSSHAKRAFMRQAAGLNGDLPKLMR